MGLDMYLYAEKHIDQYEYGFSNGEHTRTDNLQYDKANELVKDMPTGSYGGISITKCVAYWRKANAVHGWIVDNLANGKDECQRINLHRDDLVRLRDVCLIGLNDRDKALPETDNTINLDTSGEGDITNRIIDEFKKQMLVTKTNTATDDNPIPPTAGFFFGGTEKDEYYYSYLANTVETINSILASDPEGRYDYYYQASW